MQRTTSETCFNNYHTPKRKGSFFPMTMWKEDSVLHLKWAAAPCPTLAVMGMFADVIYGDKTVGAYAWVFFNDGANKHTPIITYHQISQFVLNYYYSAIYFCAKKRRNIRTKRKKEYELVLWRRRRSFLFPLSHSLFLCQFWWDSSSGPPRLARSQRPGPCLDFGFQYALTRNNRSKKNWGRI